MTSPTQLPLFDRWIDGRLKQPLDGQKVLAYSLIEEPAEALPMFQRNFIDYDGMTISGPTVLTYNKQLVESGVSRPAALWQPVDDLPRVRS